MEKVIHQAGGKGTLEIGKVIIISSNNSRFRLGSVRQLAAIVLTVGACLAIPAMASAQTVDPTDSQYGNVVQQVSSGGSACQDNSGSGSAAGTGASNCAPPPSSCASSSGSASGTGSSSCSHEAGGLPFTGLDVAGMVGVAAFLLLAGVGLRRARFGERTEA
jgi:hypothetical protein